MVRKAQKNGGGRVVGLVVVVVVAAVVVVVVVMVEDRLELGTKHARFMRTLTADCAFRSPVRFQVFLIRKQCAVDAIKMPGRMTRSAYLLRNGGKEALSLPYHNHKWENELPRFVITPYLFKTVNGYYTLSALVRKLIRIINYFFIFWDRVDIFFVFFSFFFFFVPFFGELSF